MIETIYNQFWLILIVRKLFNYDLQKTINPDNTETYSWEKWK